jgi:hypothetical protein
MIDTASSIASYWISVGVPGSNPCPPGLFVTMARKKQTGVCASIARARADEKSFRSRQRVPTPWSFGPAQVGNATPGLSKRRDDSRRHRTCWIAAPSARPGRAHVHRPARAGPVQNFSRTPKWPFNCGFAAVTIVKHRFSRLTRPHRLHQRASHRNRQCYVRNPQQRPLRGLRLLLPNRNQSHRILR